METEEGIYGLNDAAREWCLKVTETSTKTGGRSSELNSAIFYWKGDQELPAICTCHVDNFIISRVKVFSNNSFLEDQTVIQGEFWVYGAVQIH